MLKLDKIQYDLKALFSFEMLKEILLKLAKSQIKIEEEIKNIKNNNLNRDKIFLKIEKIIGKDLNIPSQPENINDVEENEENNKIELSDNINNLEGNKDIINEEEKVIIDGVENIKSINEDNKKENSKLITMDLNQGKNKEINYSEYNQKDSGNKENIQTSNELSENQKKSIDGAFISPDLFSKMMKQLKDHQNKISILEKKINSESKYMKNIDNELKNHCLNNESEFKLINEKIISLLEKNSDYDQNLENLQVKMSEFDIFSMFKDNGDGTIDATKIMVKALEEKVFKKFDLIDKRYKIDSLDNIKTKSNIENIMPKLDQFNRELKRIKEISNQYQEDFEKFKNERDDQNDIIKNNIKTDIKNNINKLKEEINNIIDNKISLIDQKIKDIKNNYGEMDILKLSLGNSDIKQEAIDNLEKKINDLRKKTNYLENTIKLCINNDDIGIIKKEIKDINLFVDKKITKDDLKELYNYHLNTVDEINDLKDQGSTTKDELRKTIKDLQNLQQRVESLNGNLSLLQKNPKTGGPIMIDFGKYVEQQKFNETLKPILKEFEKVYREISSIRRLLSVDEEENKNNLKKEINKLEEEFNNKINELKNIHKKYLEKNEFLKVIKNLEYQIKSLGEENKKDADSWLLAKRPLKCFNCASCEANIKNDYSTADYLPWKKYPRGEKIHRMGEGFSHMLQMMTSEFVKSIEKSEIPLDFEINSRNNINQLGINKSTQFNDKTAININTKEDFIKNLKHFSKMKLPKVNQFSSSKMKLKKYEDSLPVSDDESNYLDNNFENEIRIKKNSPEILQIRKKGKSNLVKGSDKNINGIIMSKLGNLTTKEINNNSGRNNIISITEKNIYDIGKNINQIK